MPYPTTNPNPTSHASPLNSTCDLHQADKSGYTLLATCTGTPPTTAGVFQHGCIMIQTNSTTGTTAQYENTGSSASPVWTLVSSPAQMATPATIATTGNTDVYVLAPKAGKVSSIVFSGVDALAANDTNYITFSVTNLGQAGAGTAALLAASNANTTKATGGTALAANTKRSLTLTATGADLVVAAGDRIRVRAAATGTLANTVTFPTYLITYGAIS